VQNIIKFSHDLCPPNPDILAQGTSTVLISAKLLDIETLMHDMHKNFYM
jgi:hypothetical protein